MIPIKQTIFPEGTKIGNSMTASYASFLDLKLNECPHVDALPYSELKGWLEEHGYEEEGSAFDPYLRKEVEGDEFYLAYGKSPRGESFYHNVVMNKGEIFHDPHPDGGGLTEITGYIIFYKIFDTLPEKKDNLVEEKEEEEVVEKKVVSTKKVDESYLKRLGFVLYKDKDPYTGRPVFKMTLIKNPVSEVTITAERLSSLVDHPDKEAWVFTYNEVGKNNARMGKKIYFQKDAERFVGFYKWINGML